MEPRLVPRRQNHVAGQTDCNCDAMTALGHVLSKWDPAEPIWNGTAQPPGAD